MYTMTDLAIFGSIGHEEKNSKQQNSQIHDTEAQFRFAVGDVIHLNVFFSHFSTFSTLSLGQ